MPITTYDEAIRWLYDRIDYERIRPPEKVNPFRLDRMRRLLQAVGDPHLTIPAVHIAGTKGKGSTAAMLDSILRAAGIRSGLFTSPHIEQFEERMRVSGQMPEAGRLTQLAVRIQTLLDQDDLHSDRFPTFFEITTLLAWLLFAEEQVELAVLETGLGGRLDCTNVCEPRVTIITSIGLDHTHLLGDTLTQIAAEKAGILKSGVPVVQGQLPGDADLVVAATASQQNCPRFVCGREFAWHATSRRDARGRARTQDLTVLTPTASYDGLVVPLLGQHQLHNASLAVMAAELLRDRGFPHIDAAAIAAGLRSTHWPLRFEVFDGAPDIVLDAAHNPDSMRAVAAALREPEWMGRKRVLVFAASADKDARAMLSIILPHFDHAVLTRFLGNPRSVSPEQLLTTAESLPGETRDCTTLSIAEHPADAIDLARTLAGDAGLVCVTGSLFLAAEVRSLVRSRLDPASLEPDR